MNFTLVFFIFIMFYGADHVTAQDDCSSTRIDNLTLTKDATINWYPLLAENCTVEFYLLEIGSGSDEEQTFTTTENTMDVSFLTMCAFAYFVIVPVSPEGVQGYTYIMITKMPVPPGVDLHLDYVRISSIEEGSFLEWSIQEEWKNCVSTYRVVIYDEEADLSDDFYTSSNSMSLSRLVPCSTYVLTVRALYDMVEEGPISLIRYTTTAARISPPTLESLSLGTTSVDLLWNLQPYTENRCSLTSVDIVSSPYFTMTFPISTVQQVQRTVFTNLTGLRSDALYLLNVTIANNAGTSDPFLVAVQTLESN